MRTPSPRRAAAAAICDLLRAHGIARGPMRVARAHARTALAASVPAAIAERSRVARERETIAARPAEAVAAHALTRQPDKPAAAAVDGTARPFLPALGHAATGGAGAVRRCRWLGELQAACRVAGRTPFGWGGGDWGGSSWAGGGGGDGDGGRGVGGRCLRGRRCLQTDGVIASYRGVDCSDIGIFLPFLNEV